MVPNSDGTYKAAQFLDACVSDYVLLPEAVLETEMMRLSQPLILLPGYSQVVHRICNNFQDPPAKFTFVEVFLGWQLALGESCP